MEALDKFEIFKAEVENQHDLKIKIVRSDCGAEYYGRHTPYDQVPEPFCEVRYGKWHSRPVFYTERASAERSSRKKKPYLDRYGQKYELWTERKPSLNQFRVWGCPAEIKVFHPNTEKLDPKTLSCHFIGYPKKSKDIASTVPTDTRSL